ncbi:MAG: acylphosphatase [Planctomycetes bacterium]|nr:acylphosphatase [Planctomycetota bacterium]
MPNSSSGEFSDLPQPPLQVIYSGRVQGVGFRWTCQAIARHHPVSGTVKNLIDGTVELFADGDGRDVRSFLAEIQQAMSGHIERVEITPVQESVQYVGFRIVY